MVRAESGEWCAIWRGKGAAKHGQQFDVEIDVDDIESWSLIDPGKRRDNGLFADGGKTSLCGQVTLVYDDGLFVLDLGGGSTLVDPDEVISEVLVGQQLCITSNAVSIFPVDF
ncbi:hypothetical protein [Nocardia lijiangensis]|uniref:hypothetical protein n=1 Tax=Nocardia lijiangensis TaxID=299618 RepID=UPI0012DEEA76|nr:hypothetical protein [Nocardia lijiangensis]